MPARPFSGPGAAIKRVTAIVLIGVMPLSALPDDKLIGTKPPEWQVTHWINSRPIALRELAGKVVLVRWWTAPGCPWCAATAPALNDFYDRYKDQALVVIGFYHHKGDGPLKMETVKRSVDRFGFKFPVAVDPDWRTLRRWWLQNDKHTWTSVSFLLDRQGTIRHIHPGGKYVKGDKDYDSLKNKIEILLRENHVANPPIPAR